MFCGQFEINLAKGIRLFNAIETDNVSLSVGHMLTDRDITLLRQAGIRHVFGAAADENDLEAHIALGIVAAKLCGPRTAYVIDRTLCKIVADADGALAVSEDRIAKFNRLNPHVILNVEEPYRLVGKGEVIAELELTLPMIPETEVNEIIFKLSGNVELLSVKPFHHQKVALIYSKFYNNAEETKHFTNVVKRLVKELSPLGLEFANEYNSFHNIEDLADTIERAFADDNQIVFIVPGVRSACATDIIPSALDSIFHEIVNPGIAQVGANDLFIAEHRRKKLISLPYNYARTETEMLNRYIKQAVFSEKLTPFDFARHQNVVLSGGGRLSAEETASLIASGSRGGSVGANVGAVVLAAGIGSRAGRNKLLFENEDGEPLFMRALTAALHSKAEPVFVITGYRAEEMEAWLEDIDVNILYNPAYRAGIKTSINLGLKSMPGFCDGALLLPADMPNITAEDLNALIAEFDPKAEKSLVMAAFQGQKSNPVIWSKSLYDVADIVPENTHLRPVFMEHADYTKLVEIKDPEHLLDVNFPSDIEKLGK